MLMTGSDSIDPERAFSRATWARRKAALVSRLRRRPAESERLRVYDERALPGSGAIPRRGIQELPLDAIAGTLEPSRAALFDRRFRPAAPARGRWQRLWIAEHRGTVLPPISVVPVADGYAVRDGHHRESVARARGALTISAAIDPSQPPPSTAALRGLPSRD
jgi:hypothetical protein